MKVYKANHQYVITFDVDSTVHISISNGYISKKIYIEYIKRGYPQIILDNNFEEIEFSELDSEIQKELKDYFVSSLKKAQKKVNVFTKAINHVSI